MKYKFNSISCLFLLFLFLVNLPKSFQKTTREFQDCVFSISQPCDVKCHKQLEEECGEKSTIRALSRCQYLENPFNQPKGPDSEWDELYGQNFQGCQESCISELDGDARVYQEQVKSCQALEKQILFSALLLIIMVLFV